MKICGTCEKVGTCKKYETMEDFCLEWTGRKWEDGDLWNILAANDVNSLKQWLNDRYQIKI